MAPTTLSKGMGTSVQPAVRQAVSKLRRDCLEQEAGTRLGHEDELLQRYDVSRPTLRQAAALVGQEQLVLVRRGPGGGYFAHRPDSSSVAHMAAIFLQVQRVKIREILLSTSTIRGELAPLAASNLDEPTEGQIRDFLDRDRAIPDEDYELVTFLKAEIEQNNLVGRASGNRVLHLYMQISLELAGTLSRSDDIFFGHRERYLDFREQRNKMLDSIVARDPDFARLEAQRCGTRLQKWLDNSAA